WLSSTASVSEVGLFNAGNTIINRYATLVFAAIGYEYYPRLSRVIDNAAEVKDHVCSEINITLLVIMPMICIYLAFNDFFITLLYSSDFTSIAPFMKWAMIGIVLKAISWCMAFTILARGEGRDYIFTEVASSIVYLLSHIYFYKYFGIIGWGYAFLTWYAAYIAIIGYFYFIKYHFSITKTTVYLSLAVTAIALIAIALTFISQIAVIALAAVVSIATLLYIKKIA
ncbi:MAG: oligosaccharide flippase family protein, partial [Muribaculaceae bacterium]